jgi:hypothetical protein
MATRFFDIVIMIFDKPSNLFIKNGSHISPFESMVILFFDIVTELPD